MIRLLDIEGRPSDSWARVKAVLSEDRNEELWEVLDNQNRIRIITSLGPLEWLEVDLEAAD